MLQSLSQEFVSLKIENDLLINTTMPTLLDSLSQDYVSLEIDNELLSNTTRFTLLDSLSQDSCPINSPLGSQKDNITPR